MKIYLQPYWANWPEKGNVPCATYLFYDYFQYSPFNLNCLISFHALLHLFSNCSGDLQQLSDTIKVSVETMTTRERLSLNMTERRI